MRRYALNERTVGFFPFEKQFLTESNHSGFVKFQDDGSVQLTTNPFMGIQEGRLCYRLPGDITVNENQLVRFSVGPKRLEVNDFDMKRIQPNSYNYFYEVQAVEILAFKPTKPSINAKEFLYGMTSNWRHAHEDRLDESVALQILSCPANFVPIGGIGSQSLNLTSKKMPLFNLEKTIRSRLPEECLRLNPKFYFGIINDPIKNRSLANSYTNKRSSEISYNYLTYLKGPKLGGESLPIAIPTIIFNSTCKKTKLEPDWNLTEYFLLAHLIDPEIPAGIQRDLADYTKEMLGDLSLRFLRMGITLDAYSVARIAQAFCRLEFKTIMDEETARKARKWMEPVFKMFFDEMEDTFETEGDAYREPKPRPTSVFDELPKRERSVLRQIITLFDDIGPEIQEEEIISKFSDCLEKGEVLESLDRLNMVGYIIRVRNQKGVAYRSAIPDDIQ